MVSLFCPAVFLGNQDPREIYTVGTDIKEKTGLVSQSSGRIKAGLAGRTVIDLIRENAILKICLGVSQERLEEAQSNVVNNVLRMASYIK